MAERTRLGVLGWPVGHSRSPAMQNAALAAVGLGDWRYQLLPVAPERRPALVDALVHAGQSSGVTLHFNKGLAGVPADALRRTRDTSMNPAVLDAFALAIAAAHEPPAYPGVAGHEPHPAQGPAAV